MSKSPEFPTILLVTGWATAATVAAFVFASTGPKVQEAAPAPAPAVTATPAPEPAAAPAAEPAPTQVAEAAPPSPVEAAEPAPAAVTPALANPLGLGRPALPEEVEAWDVAVLPDGTGLPVGSGDVETGDAIFGEHCAACHGDFAEGLDAWPVLAGGAGSLRDPRPVKTIGSYWPYLSTVFDYVHRSMPFGNAQTLSVDDTYAITAFLLYSNGIVEDDFVLSNENFTSIVMPNAEGFYVDDRATTEYPLFSAEPCMENCRESAPQVTKRAVELNVTPTDPDGKPAGTLPVITVASTGEAAAPAAEATAGMTEAPVETAEAAATEVDAEPAPAGADPALIAAGETVFKKCAACHKVGEGAKNGVGPALNGIVGAGMGQVEGFKYSDGLASMGAEGRVWDAEALHAFLEDPRGFVKGTKMSFAGLKKAEERDAVIAYLATFE
ncbi:c-type cytochrome [Tabrizicola caldifontis]|uniref:c-type cytochrome n=1 Tax=Tabrizicola caldifontis TaxID=2528036 RepID=UPI001080496E|nr:c-type cytochrome [Rhodobacter sp. YIM 73028]